jgi:non-specific serine/threonine protein kinase/serine/threonine-protein kinase
MQAIRDLFDTLTELPPAERELYFLAHPELDQNQVQAVRDLLRADESSDSLPSLEDAQGADSPDNTAEFAPGDTLGHYKLIRRMGSGGTGVVYEAVRENDGIRMQVAIKLLHRELCTPDFLLNLRYEAEALAQLRHPLIARLIDWNLDSGATSYCVLDFIDGQPITSWCSSHQLPETDRLKLFLDLCVAVAYAHQNLIGHFDLKPQNVMVNRDGGLRLIDFGIARMLTPDKAGDKSRNDLQSYTPRYASPEQIRGEKLTLRSDIYSLGLMLREILAGREEAGEHLPLLPSLLEAISSRATAQNIEQRYETVEQLKSDIENYLAHRPLLAEVPDKLYRTRLFVRRNRFPLAFWGVVLLVLCTSLSLWQMTRTAAEERRRAEKLGNSIHEFSYTLLGPLQDDVRNSPGATPVRMMVARTGVAFLNNLVEQSRSNPSLAVELAQAYTKLGDIQGNPAGPNLGDEAGARASYEAARQLLRNQTTPQSQLPYGLLLTHEGDLLSGAGDHPTAKQMYAEAVRVLAACKPTAAEQLSVEQNLVFAYLDLGDEQSEDREQSNARVSYSNALEIARRLRDQQPQNITYQRAYARSLSRLGDLESNLGNWQAAADAYRQSFTIYERLLNQNPENLRVRHSWIAGANNLALANEHMGHENEALAIYLRVEDLAQHNLQRDPQDTAAQRDLQVSESNLGRVYIHLDRLTEAERASQKELALAQAFFHQNQQDDMARGDVADALEYAAKIQARKHNYVAAIAYQDRSLQLVRISLEHDNNASNLGPVVEALIHCADYRLDAAEATPATARRRFTEAEKQLQELHSLTPRLRSAYAEDKERVQAIAQLDARLHKLR